MINRIRDIRLQKRLTLADVAGRCDPPTTAQTIGRLETGTRNLSLAWMNRIGAALDVEPELLLRSEKNTSTPKIVARLSDTGAEALTAPHDATLPTQLLDGSPRMALSVDVSVGEYRAGDQVWLRQVAPQNAATLVNRDILAPRSGGRFAFGRLIDLDRDKIALLPPGPGQRQVIIEHPAWLAVAEMLMRPL